MRCLSLSGIASKIDWDKNHSCKYLICFNTLYIAVIVGIIVAAVCRVSP